MRHKWETLDHGCRCVKCGGKLLFRRRPSKKPGPYPGAMASYTLWLPKGKKLSEAVEVDRTPPCEGKDKGA